ncbi:hypothetical protein JQ604_26495 [Bradyrhizobium jicamae]|uniref:hypothetical protein n=1 Tax=Bradyrhizobium jicamae TaxID=280332 RepID=UPI001BA6ED70|nr:hypothetical protein [Bradyrhizobium jicamae]MBR0755738.1 hypothetical protein [Bradyrhizobium jicamae]
MNRRCTILAVSMLSITGSASAADLPAKASPAVAVDTPFFKLIDDRITVSWMPAGTDPGNYSIRPDGSINGKTAKQVYSFTHFDIWAYGTNFFNISLLKSDHNDPANPCTNAGVIFNPTNGTTTSAACEGASEIFGQIRSTFGWNEIFNTKAFAIDPLRNISFAVGLDANTVNNRLAPAKRDVVAGLQFQFALPYKGFFNVSPLMYWDFANHNGFAQCGSGFSGPVPGVNCLIDGHRSYNPTWAIETNYYMDLGFLPESMQFFSISGRAAWYGPKGTESNPLPYNPLPVAAPANLNTTVEFNAEPIRLTFDASKAAWGPKYSHFVDMWVAYRYWQNKFGLDHEKSRLCNVSPGVSNNTCTESTIYSGITMKF